MSFRTRRSHWRIQIHSLAVPFASPLSHTLTLLIFSPFHKKESALLNEKLRASALTSPVNPLFPIAFSTDTAPQKTQSLSDNCQSTAYYYLLILKSAIINEQKLNNRLFGGIPHEQNPLRLNYR